MPYWDARDRHKVGGAPTRVLVELWLAGRMAIAAVTLIVAVDVDRCGYLRDNDACALVANDVSPSGKFDTIEFARVDM